MKLLRQSISTLALLVACIAFGPLGSAPADAQALVKCSTTVDCAYGTGPYNTGTGYQAGDAFGAINGDLLLLPPQLFSGAALPVNKGGTGALTLTGPLKGNGTSAISPALAADIYALWSGTCSSTTFLRGDGSCQTPSGGGSVTTASVVSANGFAGTVATATTTPAITLTTSITGPLKGASSALQAAVAADIYGLWSGTCSSSTFLRGDGSCQTPSGGGNVNNTGTPTAGQFAEWTSATVIGGQTLIGDCSLSTATITCLKTNGTSFGALATTVPGTGVATALGVNTGSAGAFVVYGGPLGTPSSGVGTNLTGTASGLSIGGNAATATSATTAANLSGTPAVPNGTTATTQTTGDNTTKLATDAFVLANAASAGVASVAAGGGIAVTGTGSGPYTGAVTVSANAPNRTVTSSPTVASTDMGGQINSNVSGGGTLTIPAISSTVFPANSTLTIVNYSASTEAVSTTPTVNAGGGCVSGTGIPAGATWNMISNGTTLDCNQSVSAGGGSGIVNGGTSGQVAYYASTGAAVSGETTLTAPQMPALTGDCTSTSGTVATTCTKINGTTVPSGAGMVSTTSSGQIQAQAVVAATAATGPTNDYSPSGFGTTTAVLYLTPTSGGSTLDGLVAQNALQQVYIVNAEAAGGADNILLVNQSSSDSTAANRFLTSATTSLAIPPGGRVLCVYLPSTVSRWSCQ